MLAGLGLWFFGGYDAAGVEGTLSAWVELMSRFVMLALSLYFFAEVMQLALGGFRKGEPKAAISYLIVVIAAAFLVPKAAAMATEQMMQSINQLMVSIEPDVDTAAQNLVRIVKQSESVLSVPATPTIVPTAMEPVYQNLVATATPDQSQSGGNGQPDAMDHTHEGIHQTTAVFTPRPTQEPPKPTAEPTFDPATWKPGDPPPTPITNR